MPTGPRIGTQRITGVDERQRLVCTVVEGDMWFADSTNSIASVKGAPLALDYLVALLNSDLMQWRFRLTSTNNNVATNELLDLPIAVNDPGAPGSHTRLDAVSKAGTRVAELKAQARSERSASGAERLSRMVAAAVSKLNGAVYDLYEIGETERQLISHRLERTPIAAQQSDDDVDDE